MTLLPTAPRAEETPATTCNREKVIKMLPPEIVLSDGEGNELGRYVLADGGGHEEQHSILSPVKPVRVDAPAGTEQDVPVDTDITTQIASFFDTAEKRLSNKPWALHAIKAAHTVVDLYLTLNPPKSGTTLEQVINNALDWGIATAKQPAVKLSLRVAEGVIDALLESSNKG